MPDSPIPRDELASRYLDQLPFEPYPVQEEALLAWFTAEEGVLVCAPTGMGKTLIAEAALFEALHNRQVAYYTTPLIALTEQKFREMQDAAERWGFSRDDVGLVTGHRCVNREATVRVVVAEILLNRLLHPEAFDFSDVAAVVMDEFHSFNDPERGIVWELSLGLLPAHVRLLLLSATVGNSAEFLIWLRNAHRRKVQLIQSTERKVPLRYEWVGDQLLNEQIEHMAEGDETTRRTPALVFCFNREQCWSVAEQLRGKSLLADGQQQRLQAEIDKHDWSKGAGPKLKPILLRGVGVHHAGMLPRYRRIVEHLFQRKLLSVCVCTETLAAGINLPARSVVLTTLLKGPPGKKKLIDASSIHQMAGRAGRPQFDTEGYVYALAHEDDVKIQRWQEKHGTVPPNTKDPNVLKAYKRLQKKAPTRRKTEQYWNAEQFQKLIVAPPARLASRGPFPWRLLAYLLMLSPEVERLRTAARKRLMDEKHLLAGVKTLTRMLITLWAGGYITLDPEPPEHMQPKRAGGGGAAPVNASSPDSPVPPAVVPPPAGDPPAASGPRPSTGTFGALLQEARTEGRPGQKVDGSRRSTAAAAGPRNAADELDDGAPDVYQPDRAYPTERLARLLGFRSVNPLYGDFLVQQLGIADPAERLQALESTLDVPGSMAKLLRVPRYNDLPPGELARTRLDMELIQRGLVTPQDLVPKEGRDLTWEERWVPTLAEKLRLLFESEFPGVPDLRVTPVWAAGDLLELGGDFNQYVTSRGLAKQEGMVFRHLLRLILLCGEFAQLCPPDTTADEWSEFLGEVTSRLTESCREVDPESTDKAIEAAKAAADVVAGEATALEAAPPADHERDAVEFGEGLFE